MVTGTHQILPWNSTSVKFKFHFNARPGLKLLLCFARKVGTRPKSSIILMTWQPFFTLHSKTRSRYHGSSLLHTIYHSLWLVHMYNVYHSTSNIMTPGILNYYWWPHSSAKNHCLSSANTPIECFIISHKACQIKLYLWAS